jgi:hypothetical protein
VHASLIARRSSLCSRVSTGTSVDQPRAKRERGNGAAGTSNRHADAQ